MKSKDIYSQGRFYIPSEFVTEQLTRLNRKNSWMELYVTGITDHLRKLFNGSKTARYGVDVFHSADDFVNSVVIGDLPSLSEEEELDYERRNKDVPLTLNLGILPALNRYAPESLNPALIVKSLKDSPYKQAICPECDKEGRLTSLWPHAAGNPLSETYAPRPRFKDKQQYCGYKESIPAKSAYDSEGELLSNVIRDTTGHYKICTFKSNLPALNYFLLLQSVPNYVKEFRRRALKRSRVGAIIKGFRCPCCDTLCPVPSFAVVSELPCVNEQCKDGVFKTFDLIPEFTRTVRMVDAFNSSNDSDDDRSISVTDTAFLTPGSSWGSPVSVAAYDNRLQSHTNNLHEEYDSLKDNFFVSLSELPNVSSLDLKFFYSYFYEDNLEELRDKDSEDEGKVYKVLVRNILKIMPNYTECLDCGRGGYNKGTSTYDMIGEKTRCTFYRTESAHQRDLHGHFLAEKYGCTEPNHKVLVDAIERSLDFSEEIKQQDLAILTGKNIKYHGEECECPSKDHKGFIIKDWKGADWAQQTGNRIISKIRKLIVNDKRLLALIKEMRDVRELLTL